MQSQPETLPIGDLLNGVRAVEEPTQVARRRFSLRAFTSMLLAGSFAVLCTSGVVLFLTPRGRTANWTGWTMLGLDKQEWSSLHVNNSILFIVIAATHLVLNWPVLLRYLRNKKLARMDKKAELAVALSIAIVCVAGPIFGVPPFSSLMSLNEDVKNYWEQDTASASFQAQPPVPHAEELTLAELGEYIQLTPEQITLALMSEDYEVDELSQTLGQIAKQNQSTPSELFAAIRNQYPETRGWGRIGIRPTEQSEGGEANGAFVPGREGKEDAHGPGFGRGQGRGMGMGRGLGPGGGMGQGRGMGLHENE